MRAKKRLSLVLALVLVLLQLPLPAFAASFSDTAGHWAEPYINWATDEGYISGYPGGRFKPNQHITTAEYYRITNQSEPTIPAETPDTTPSDGGSGEDDIGGLFNDVKEDDWFYKEVKKGVAKGYVKTEGKTSLKPNEKITREEAIRIMAFNQGWAENPGAVERFKDKDQISGDCKGLVGAAISNGILEGYPDGTFRPKGFLSRAEVVTLIGKLKNADVKPVLSSGWYWSFTNSSKNFTKGYEVLGRDWQGAGGSMSSRDTGTMKSFQRWLNKGGWGGSCYGMAFTVGMYRDQTLNVKDLNDSGTSNIGEIKAEAKYRPQSIINLFHLTQATPSYKECMEREGLGYGKRVAVKNCKSVKEFGEKVIPMLQRAKNGGTLVQIGVFWDDPANGEKCGHAMVGYDYATTAEGLSIKLYDPNDQCKEITLDYGANKVVGRNLSTTATGELGDITVLGIDACGTKGLFDSHAKSNKAVQKYLNLAEDKTVKVQTDSATLNLDPKKDDGASQFKDAPGYSYQLPGSGTYNVSGPGSTAFGISGPDTYISVDVEKPGVIQVKDDKVDLKNSTGAFTVSISDNKTPGGFDYNTVTISGKDAKNVTFGEEGGKLVLTGDNIADVKVVGNKGDKEQAIKVGNEGGKVVLTTDNGKILVNGKPGKKPVDDIYQPVYVDDTQDPLEGSWIGNDNFQYGQTAYRTDTSFHIKKNPNGTYNITEMVVFNDSTNPGFNGKYVQGVYKNLTYSKSKNAFYLAKDAYVTTKSDVGNIVGAAVDLKFDGTKYTITYGNGKVCTFERF